MFNLCSFISTAHVKLKKKSLFVFFYFYFLQIEEEIVTLRQALDRKEKQLAEIKHLLGITAWTQLRDGIQHQYQNIQGTQM